MHLLSSTIYSQKQNKKKACFSHEVTVIQKKNEYILTRITKVNGKGNVMSNVNTELVEGCRASTPLWRRYYSFQGHTLHQELKINFLEATRSKVRDKLFFCFFLK